MSTEGERRHWRKQWHTRSQDYMKRTTAHRKLHQQTPAAKAVFARAAARMIAKYPEKMMARSLVGRALLRGDLSKEPCEVCGNRSEAHHDDYSKPLAVRWLCRRHHQELEGRILSSTIEREAPQ